MTPHDQQGFGGPPPPGSDPVTRAAELVKVPAILLMVMGGLILATALYGLVTSGGAEDFDKALADPNLPANAKEILEQWRSVILMLSARAWELIPIAASALIFFGGWQLRQVKSYGLAMAASVVAMLPLFPACCCCVFGLPVGIWSIVVLMKPEVKAAFQGR